MSNKYGLPDAELEVIRLRDNSCVYCHKQMFDPRAGGWRGDWATIEHLNHLPPWNNPKTVAISCWSCNSSRGNKKLSDWFQTAYCTQKNIGISTVADPVKRYIKEIENYL